MYRLLRNIVHLIFCGKLPHYHEWGNWRDVNQVGVWNTQIRYCKSCNKMQSKTL